MKIAVQGCCHGELDRIYETIAHIEQVQNFKVDLLICCGDFQAIRSEEDLASLAVPDKYKQLGCFRDYHSGKKIAPVLTLFIGGNHESSRFLQELFYGGWAAPNIYYLGSAGVVNFAGWRIAGLSGIFKQYDFQTGHYEKPPYSKDDVRSIYHVREQEVFRLMHLNEPVDIFLSHDWPQGILRYGDTEALFRKKAFLRKEEHTLGNPAASQLLQRHQPIYWFSAHMHVKFPALIPHTAAAPSAEVPTSAPAAVTRFLALDKVLPGRDFLQILDLPARNDDFSLSVDREWLAMLGLSRSIESAVKRRAPLPVIPPGPGSPFAVTAQHLEVLDSVISDRHVPKHPVLHESAEASTSNQQPFTLIHWVRNLQSVFAQRSLAAIPGQYNVMQSTPNVLPAAVENPEEVDLDMDNDEEPIPVQANPEEVDLDDIESIQ